MTKTSSFTLKNRKSRSQRWGLCPQPLALALKPYLVKNSLLRA